MKSRCYFAVVLFLVALGLATVSCSPGKKESAQKPVGEKAEEVQKPVETGVAGKEILERVCTVCHSLERVKNAKKDRAGWEATVDKMIKIGAQLSEEEKKIVVDYLSGGM